MRELKLSLNKLPARLKRINFLHLSTDSIGVSFKRIKIINAKAAILKILCSLLKIIKNIAIFRAKRNYLIFSIFICNSNILGKDYYAQFKFRK